MADHGGNGGTEEVVDQSEDRGRPMENPTEDQQSVKARDQRLVEAIADTSATVGVAATAEKAASRRLIF
ncbi:hypothetical protein RHMOL_Rhmol08G0130900 [Rhododendron molle]|uniref:Uncharacterized protein n=1 Tax=Rhododendron molle TaxID=49168 RepID=A0ACC0MPW1_RHOML|nr:hypothetical protein RHMOL_Rhmol08G0130900 [Rhododendron molle]